MTQLRLKTCPTNTRVRVSAYGLTREGVIKMTRQNYTEAFVKLDNNRAGWFTLAELTEVEA